ncbi:hypothetical protein HNY73_013001 [Argiope bruennichi]|uniref:Uncharacterized protein n=2 Tax=Argiope bruennichi TaxID=94029 RepID=A0A8T0EWN3_ARGBR|nr:hypothetical protein HNY73_013001 [Argiope bruennichi]
MQQWSFMCGNQTVFNQFSFTCSNYDEAVPCGSSGEFFYLNGNLRAGPGVFFHNEQDVAKAASLIPGRSAQPNLPPVAPPPVGVRPPFRG